MRRPFFILVAILFLLGFSLAIPGRSLSQGAECSDFPSIGLCEKVREYLAFYDALPPEPLNDRQKAAIEERHGDMVKLQLADNYRGTPCHNRAWDLEIAISKYHMYYSKLKEIFESAEWKLRQEEIDELGAKVRKARLDIASSCRAIKP